MRWRQTRYSDNVQDRRRMSPAVGAGIGGVGLLLVIAFALLSGQDPVAVLEQVASQADGGAVVSTRELTPEEVQAGQFVSQILADTEDTWSRILPEQSGRQYEPPTLVLFTDQVNSACGFASAAVGPFYCPLDASIYVDLSFFEELGRRFGAEGDFAQAYIVAHEVGHHVEALGGILQAVDEQKRGVGEAGANELSVRVELMADCLAGVWANQAQQANLVLDEADVTEGINAAAAVGDDRLQMQTRGYVVPDAFTHGTSEQRVTWFMNGLRTGSMAACDTFSN